MRHKTDTQPEIMTLLDARIAFLQQRRRRVYSLDEPGGYRFMRWLRYDAQLGELCRLRRDVAALVEAEKAPKRGKKQALKSLDAG